MHTQHGPGSAAPQDKPWWDSQDSPAHIPVLPHIPAGSGVNSAALGESREQSREDGQPGDVPEVSREQAEGKGRESQKEKRLAKNFQLSHRNLCKCLQPLHAQEAKFTHWLLLLLKTA